MEVRHIVLEGSNKEIGRALGDIAQNDYNVNLLSYSKPEYKTQREKYTAKNYPFMAKRMQGVAESYNLPENHNFITSMLVYDIIPAIIKTNNIVATQSTTQENIQEWEHIEEDYHKFN